MCIWCLNERAALLTGFIAARAFLFTMTGVLLFLLLFLKCILLFQNRSESDCVWLFVILLSSSLSLLLLSVLLLLLLRWKSCRRRDIGSLFLCTRSTPLHIRGSRMVSAYYYFLCFMPSQSSHLPSSYWKGGSQMRNSKIQGKGGTVILPYLNIIVPHSLFRTLMHRTYTGVYNIRYLSFSSLNICLFFLTFISVKQIFIFPFFFPTQYHAQQGVVCFIISIKWLCWRDNQVVKYHFSKQLLEWERTWWKHRNGWK